MSLMWDSFILLHVAVVRLFPLYANTTTYISIRLLIVPDTIRLSMGLCTFCVLIDYL